MTISSFASTPIAGVTVVDGTATNQTGFSPGTTVMANDGSMLVYVTATSTISQYNAVVIDAFGGAVPVTTTNSTNSKRVAFAQTSIASSYFGWVQVGGRPLVSLAANCAPNVPLYTTATAGILDDATVSGGLILGMVATNTISNATAVTCVGAVGTMIGTGNAVN